MHELLLFRTASVCTCVHVYLGGGGGYNKELNPPEVQIIIFPSCAVLCVTVTREGQNTSSTITVPNGGTKTVLYTFTHPPGLYSFQLKERSIGSEGTITLTDEINGPQMGHATLRRYSSDGSEIERHVLLVPGNNITNGSTVICEYKEPDISSFVNCDSLNPTTLTVVVLDEGKHKGEHSVWGQTNLVVVRPVRIMLFFPAYYAMLQFFSNLPIMLLDFPIKLRGFTYYAQILNEKYTF